MPRPADGVVVVGAGTTRLHGISLEDGTERWSYAGEGLDKNAATVADSTAYVGSRDGRVIAIDVAGGSERWTFGTDTPVRGGMVVHNGLVYASTTGQRVYALTTEGGNEQWRRDVSSGGNISIGDSWPVLRVLGQFVYVAYAGRLYALMASDGTEQWRTDIDVMSVFLQLSGDTIYVSGEGSSDQAGVHGSALVLKAFNRRDGRERWSTSPGGEFIGTPPVVAERTVCTGTEDGVIHAFDKRDGGELWTVETGADTLHGPVVNGDTVYVGTER